MQVPLEAGHVNSYSTYVSGRSFISYSATVYLSGLFKDIDNEVRYTKLIIQFRIPFNLFLSNSWFDYSLNAESCIEETACVCG